ncbi:hypothetical protein [Neobacillus niacini]|uniref:hypothetical protein n=1 Tax=Neobacillus niacini TaxID=86668 RepID=UPI003983B5FA
MIYGNNNSNNMLPLTNVDNKEINDVKLNEDQYEVYVNGDFVGRKTLKTQGENLTDIDDFLRNQGFSNFTSSVDGDHYKIQADQQSNDLSNALSVYFNNR